MSVNILIVSHRAKLSTELSPQVDALGYHRATASCLDSACLAIQKQIPDLALLDADLIKQNPNLCQNLRRSCPDKHLPILLLISKIPKNLAGFLSQTGVDDYLLHPFTPEEFQARLMLRLPGQTKGSVPSLAQIDFSFLAGLSNLAVSELGTSEILQRVIDAISTVIEIHRCSIAMVREDHEFGYIMASSDDPKVNGLRIDLDRYPEIQETLRTGRPLVIEDIAQHPVMKSVRLYIEKLGFNSILVLPMVDRQRIIGVLVLRTARSMVGFTEEEVSFCQLVANVATSALRLAEIRQIDRKQIEPAVETSDEKKLRQQRSSLLGMAAHDLRVLVSVIDGYCLLLGETDGSRLSKEQHEIVGGLMTGSRRLVDMANNLLDFSRIEAGRFDLKKGQENICSIIASVYGEVQPLLHHREIRFQTDCLDKNAMVLCDEQGIRRVLYNIVSNALKYTPDGGCINLNMIEDQDEVRVSIEDSGPGIDPDFLVGLFSEFRGTTSPGGHPGSGLGLSICKKIIEAHQGRIWAESSLGQGSCFTFCLPKAT